MLLPYFDPTIFDNMDVVAKVLIAVVEHSYENAAAGIHLEASASELFFLV